MHSPYVPVMAAEQTFSLRKDSGTGTHYAAHELSLLSKSSVYTNSYINCTHTVHQGKCDYTETLIH